VERWSEPCLVKAVVTRLRHLLHVVKSNNPKTTPDPVFKEPPVQLTDNFNSATPNQYDTYEARRGWFWSHDLARQPIGSRQKAFITSGSQTQS
jgi:hypothetical protein